MEKIKDFQQQNKHLLKSQTNELILNLEKLHTTPLGEKRIIKNLNLPLTNVVEFCYNIIVDSGSIITRTGKNWYVTKDDIVLTINATSYTIITAHKLKERRNL